MLITASIDNRTDWNLFVRFGKFQAELTNNNSIYTIIPDITKVVLRLTTTFPTKQIH